MITLHIQNTKGEARKVEVEPTGSLKDAIRDNGFDDLVAACGGHCSCATCHVIIEDNFYARLDKPSEDEQDLLDSSDDRQDCSRLSCQVPLSDQLDGMFLRII